VEVKTVKRQLKKNGIADDGRQEYIQGSPYFPQLLRSSKQQKNN
jgi:hypothetical protein